MNGGAMIIPEPKFFCLAADRGEFPLPCTVCAADAQARPAAECFAALAQRIHGVEISVRDGEGAVRLCRDEALDVSEYRLACAKGSVEVSYSAPEGLNYALSTLLQLMWAEKGELWLPACEIRDRPDSPYRALMVDVARKRHTLAELLGYVDLCWLYKIRLFHIHFADTNAYTLPSDLLPELPGAGKHCFSREEIDTLTAYARSRNIEIVPEIEMPGHSSRMIATYPELFADTPTAPPARVGGYAHNIICAGKEGVMETLKALCAEVIAMFPDSRCLHIGGDEAQIGEWESCEVCRAYMEREGIRDVRGLYTDFMCRAIDAVLELGRIPIVWEGFPKEGAEKISRECIVIAWESYYHLAPDLLAEGFRIVNCSWEPLYTIPAGRDFLPDGRWYPEDIFNWDVYTWKNWNDMSPAHKNPIRVAPTDQVLGGGLCAWENHFEGEIVGVIENLAALSERTWNRQSSTPADRLCAGVRRLAEMAKKLLGRE
ncbi:MAG: family 20 glycosylhydrolase [Clostridia bacterium]|nr:family 20 glycosylhydrolase [Clostridia bacterium]